MSDFTRFVVYMPPELKQQFRELAFDNRLSQSQLALKVLSEYVRDNTKVSPSTPNPA